MKNELRCRANIVYRAVDYDAAKIDELGPLTVFAA